MAEVRLLRLDAAGQNLESCSAFLGRDGVENWQFLLRQLRIVWRVWIKKAGGRWDIWRRLRRELRLGASLSRPLGLHGRELSVDQ